MYPPFKQFETRRLELEALREGDRSKRDDHAACSRVARRATGSRLTRLFRR